MGYGRNTDKESVLFPVQQQPVYRSHQSSYSESYIKIPNFEAIVDVEKNHVFSVVTKSYQLVTNREALEMTFKAAKKVFSILNPESFEVFNIVMPGTRSFCHVDLIARNTVFEPFKNDKWVPFIRMTNSYNRTKLLSLHIGFCRWICTNGLIFGETSVKFSSMHMKGLAPKLDRFSEDIGDIQKMETQFVERLIGLKRYHVPKDKTLPLVCKVFGIRVNPIEIRPKRKETLIRLRDKIEELTKQYFTELGENGYAALNILTDLAIRPVSDLGPAGLVHSYQEASGRWMRDFIKEIKKDHFDFEEYLGKEVGETANLIMTL